jgi:iron-sulfur cluster assembly accessory protein
VINLTESAKEYLTEMLSTQDKEYAFLSVNGGGCSGFQYKWDMLDAPIEDGDLVDDILYVDKIATMFVIGCTVDYVKEFGGSYLKVINPNATASCGCGESFAV